MSLFKITCPSCSKKLQVRASLDGKKVKCSGCNTVLRVRVPKQAPSPSTVANPERASRPRQTDIQSVPAPAPQDDLFTLPPAAARQFSGPGQLQGTPRYISNPKAVSGRKRRKKKKKKKQRAAFELFGLKEEYGDWASRVGGSLIFFGILACLSPLFDFEGGRVGKARMLMTGFQMFGPFAPLVGLVLGGAGAALLASGLKKSGSGAIAGASFLLLIVCAGLGTAPTVRQLAAKFDGGSKSNSKSSQISKSSSRSSSSKKSRSGWGSLFGSSDRSAIVKVLDKHNEIFDTSGYSTMARMNRRMSNVSRLGNLRAQVSRIEVINTSACPQDFRDAYGKHVSAYRSLVDYASRNDKLFYDSQAELDQYKRKVEQLAKNVESTADQTNKIAENYGVKIIK